MNEEKLWFAALLLGAYAIYAFWEAFSDWKKPRKGLIDMDVESQIVSKQTITTQLDYLKGQDK